MSEAEWTEDKIKHRLAEIKELGYIPIPEDRYRNDDGVVGQILERKFNVSENNLKLGDLGGTFELKAMRNRKNKSNLTLGHQKPIKGMSTKDLFERYGYVRQSKRHPEIEKIKLFTTVKGSRYNNLGFKLVPVDEQEGFVELHHIDDGYLSTWKLNLEKTQNMILVFADTKGKANTVDEQFHFVKGFLFQNLNTLNQLVTSGFLVMDLCIDQPADKSKSMHDRGPHWRISTKKLPKLYKSFHQVL